MQKNNNIFLNKGKNSVKLKVETDNRSMGNAKEY